MTQPMHFEELLVGSVWRSRARTITQADVVAFAGLTGDYDPLHVDHEYAKQTPFGQPIAHGLLGLAIVAGLGSNFPMVDTVAFVALRNWEFLKPVFIGDTVHAVNEVVERRDNGRRRGHVVWKRQLVNQAGEVVQQGLFETLVAKSPAASNRVPPPEVAKPPAKTRISGQRKSAAPPAPTQPARRRKARNTKPGSAA